MKMVSAPPQEIYYTCIIYNNRLLDAICVYVLFVCLALYGFRLPRSMASFIYLQFKFSRVYFGLSKIHNAWTNRRDKDCVCECVSVQCALWSACRAAPCTSVICSRIGNNNNKSGSNKSGSRRKTISNRIECSWELLYISYKRTICIHTLKMIFEFPMRNSIRKSYLNLLWLPLPLLHIKFELLIR